MKKIKYISTFGNQAIKMFRGKTEMSVSIFETEKKKKNELEEQGILRVHKVIY